MKKNKREVWGDCRERGATLVLIAFSMIMLLGMTGLAIDLVSLYVGRSEAQRAADAGALAGATVFATTGCTTSAGGCVAGGAHETTARQRAINVATQNAVGGLTPVVNPADVTFQYPTPLNPTITVTVARDTGHGNAMPTFFMRIFGVTQANISASATAEAFNPSGSGIPVGTKCLKPWMMPNCDANRLVAASDPNHNPNCQDPTNPAMYGSFYVNSSTNTIVNPGTTPAGVQGDLIAIKPGDPSQAPAPGKFYPIFLPPGSVASACPACASGGGGAGCPSGSLYRQNIACCNENNITCGNRTITAITGNMVGPTGQGVDCLIHQQGNTGQDTIDPSTFTMTAGSRNPFFPVGTILSTSDSIVTVPLYDGGILAPGMGGSCGSATASIQVVGFMQIFIKREANPQATVEAYIMNIAACNGSAGGGGGSPPTPISGGTGSPIPIRLIQRP